MNRFYRRAFPGASSASCLQYQFDRVLTVDLQLVLVRSYYRPIRPPVSPHVPGPGGMLQRKEIIQALEVAARNLSEKMYALMVRSSLSATPRTTSSEY